MKEFIAIIMPVFNEEAGLESAIESCLALMARQAHSQLIVVDDGSTDRTPQILKRCTEKDARLHVLTQPNGGHGQAILAGYRAALAQNPDWIFQIDSDVQIPLDDFSLLWNQRTKSPFVLGCRQNRQDPFYRRLMSGTNSLLLLGLFGRWIPDPNIPFRLMKASLLRDLLQVIPSHVFAPNIFLSLQARRQGLDTLNIPVRHQKRATGQTHLNWGRSLTVGLRVVRELFQFRLRARTP